MQKYFQKLYYIMFGLRITSIFRGSSDGTSGQELAG